MWKRRSRKSQEKGHTDLASVIRDQTLNSTLKSCLRDSDQGSYSSRSDLDDGSNTRDSSASKGSKSNQSMSTSTFASDREPLSQSAASGDFSAQSKGQSSQASGRPSSALHTKSVRFSEVHVRDYERVVGDNPSCSSGPPMG